MQPRIDWPSLCKDWAASGLSKNRYFLSDRLDRFVRYGRHPSYSTVMHHLANYEKEAKTVETPSVPDAETAVIHHLSAEEMRVAISAGDAGRTNGRKISNRVTLVLANGTTIEFEAENAEHFALQAISLGRLA